MCLKEQKRIQELSETLMITVVPSSEQKEYAVNLPVYDVRDYTENAAAAGIFTIGGFIGELMISLDALKDYCNTKGDTKIELDQDIMLKFFEQLLPDGYPQEICTIRMS